MIYLKNFFFLALTVTAAVIPRDANAVLDGLKKIDADTRYLGKANEGYNGSAASAAPILAGVTSLQTDLNATVATAQASSPFSKSGAAAIIDFVNNPLVPDTKFTLGTLEANKEKIRQGGFEAAVQQQLASLKAAVDKLACAIENKTPDSLLAAAKKALGDYQDEYAGAVAFFAS